MKRTMRIQGMVLLVIFTITQLTWAVNSCPTCFARSFNLQPKVSESSGSCCSTESTPVETSECNTCSGGNCRCSSLDTFDDIEALLVSVITVDEPVELDIAVPSFFILRIQQYLTFYSPLAKRPNWLPPPLYYGGCSHFKTDIIRI